MRAIIGINPLITGIVFTATFFLFRYALKRKRPSPRKLTPVITLFQTAFSLTLALAAGLGAKTIFADTAPATTHASPQPTTQPAHPGVQPLPASPEPDPRSAETIPVSLQPATPPQPASSEITIEQAVADILNGKHVNLNTT